MTGDVEYTAGFCRDCLAPTPSGARRCPDCHSPRVIEHAELFDLSIAHIDCDAFYAAVEKRDNPKLAEKPVIIGGGKRGVVATACYDARVRGVRSAMPMFKALKACPDAVVIRPDMKKYARAGRKVRELMRELTPLVEPLSIDEAFLDLTGTSRLAGAPPAVSLARLARKIHEKIGISVSIGLSHNKFLAKVASDLDKPRGFSVIGKAETRSFLRSRPVSTIWGVGKMTQKSLARSGVTEISHLLKCDQADLVKQYGVMGVRLYQFARGIDHRKVSPVSETKSISNETTFNEDIRDLDVLERALWKLCENVSRRAKKAGLAGRTITIKLKSASFRTRTRSTSLDEATLLAERIFAAARPHLARECTGTSWRLLGAGISHLEPADPEKAPLDLDSGVVRQAKAELAMDKLRNKFGPEAVTKGRGLERKP